MAKKEIILVDEKDREVGVGEKLKIHQEGKLHRAFSILIFNSKGQMLLQRRAKTKYHSPSLWSNACCSHPKPNKKLLDEAKRRLKEEMGFVCDLKESFSFVYKAKVEDLIEYEFDHVFLGKFDGNPKPDKAEVEDWKWVVFKEVKKDVEKNSENYTPWFKILLDKVYDKV